MRRRASIRSARYPDTDLPARRRASNISRCRCCGDGPRESHQTSTQTLSRLMSTLGTAILVQLCASASVTANSTHPNVLMFAVDDLRPLFGKAFGYEEVGGQSYPVQFSLTVHFHCLFNVHLFARRGLSRRGRGRYSRPTWTAS